MAMQLSDFDGERVYLDTMLPYLLLRKASAEVRGFFDRLEKGEFIAFTSVLMFDELAYRLLLALIRDAYGGSPLDQLRNHEPELLSEFASPVRELLQQVVHFPHLTVVDLLANDIPVMNDGMERYRLRPRDALHLATMQRVGCTAIASSDPHFDRIPHILRYSD